MGGTSCKWLIVGALLASVLLVAGSATARVSVKPCTGGCDDGDGPSVNTVLPAKVVDPGPPPPIDDSDQPADDDVTDQPTGQLQDSGPPSSSQSSSPQVVTALAPQAPAAVTTKTATEAPPKPPPICSNLPALTALPPTMDRDAATGICSPKCLNHPDFTFLPDRWYKQADGNCYYRGEDNFGVCKGDQFVLATRSTVESLLNSGYGMGIWVDGVPPDRHMNCLVTDLATYGLNPEGYVFSGKYVQDGGPQDGIFDSPTPRKEWAIPLYPYWVPKTQAAAYAQHQSVTSIMAYGLLWGKLRYNNANSFARQLRHQGGSWKNWKKNHPVQAQALAEHTHLLRQLK